MEREDFEVSKEVEDWLDQLEQVLEFWAELVNEHRDEHFQEWLIQTAKMIRHEIETYGHKAWWDAVRDDERRITGFEISLATFDHETATPEQIQEYNRWFAEVTGLPELN